MIIEDTIDAFVDGMTVEPGGLDDALGSADGRAYLLDALALRGLMRDERLEAEPAKPKPSWPVPSLTRAAVIALAFGGLGYAAGVRNGETPAPTIEAPMPNVQVESAPEPTRVIEIKQWHETQGGD